jgi:putative membrane protein
MKKATSSDKNNARTPRSFSLNKPEKTVTANQTSKAKASKRKPKAMKIDQEIILQSDDAVDEAYGTIDQLTPPPPAPYKRKRFGWGKLAITAFGALFAISIGLAIDQLIRDLFSRNDWLGWAAMGLAIIGALAVLAVIIRELWAISRLKNIDALRLKGAKAIEENDLKQARSVTGEITSLFQNRADTANARAQLSIHQDDIMDGADLVKVLERDLLAPLDKKARSLVMGSAKRVSVVTAVSPRAIVDIGFVLYENIRLIRNISEHYGGKPGALSSVRLIKEVLTHLAATGAIAVGDGLLQQVIGQGLAARLSARLGEGVVNGLLTARIGIAAIDVCRPLKFEAEKRPGIGDFISELTNLQKKEA